MCTSIITHYAKEHPSLQLLAVGDALQTVLRAGVVEEEGGPGHLVVRLWDTIPGVVHLSLTTCIR